MKQTTDAKTDTTTDATTDAKTDAMTDAMTDANTWRASVASVVASQRSGINGASVFFSNPQEQLWVHTCILEYSGTMYVHTMPF